MANLGNLIVRGVTRILGDAYANKFIGNLQGNADTATSAIKASTADSATSAASANKASIATAVQDYGTSDYREIKIGYNGSGLSSSTITHAVGFTDGGTKIKDISKDEFRNWLATASGTWNISILGNADTVDGQHLITQVSDWNTDSLSIFKSSENSISNAPTSDFIYGVTLRFHRDPLTYHTDIVSKLYSDRLFFRRKTEEGYHTWRELIHSGNISSQSVNYANNAGSVAWANVTGKPNTFTPTTHTHTFDSLTSKPTTISGYGITDAYTKTECNNKFQLKGAYLTEQNLQGYATTTWVNSNYYTCSESDNRYIRSETDPVWTAAKGNYYTKTECNNKFQPKGTYLTEQNLQGYATQEWVRGEEYLYRSGGTMDARAEIGITTKLFIGNSTSSDTCYTKFNCILHGGGNESNPNWIIRDNGYAEFKSSVSANAFYASSDIRLKNILDDINIDFDKLKLIPKKYYTWKGSDILQLGTIAQDIQKIYPEVVSKNENGYLSVDYSKLSIIALAAIDKLNERIKELECQIKL